MFIKLPSIYHKIKASVLLICLGFVILGTCPIQKFILSASPVEVETSTQTSISSTVVNTTCSSSEEIVKAPLVDLTKKSNNNALYFILLSTLAYLFTSFLSSRYISVVNSKIFLVSPISLFLKNQVFRI